MAEHAGDLIIRQLMLIAQGDEQPVALRQAGDLPVQIAPPLLGLDAGGEIGRRLVRQRLQRRLPERGQVAPQARQAAIAFIRGDAVEPGAERRLAPVARQPLPGADEGLLDDILGFGCVASVAHVVIHQDRQVQRRVNGLVHGASLNVTSVRSLRRAQARTTACGTVLVAPASVMSSHAPSSVCTARRA